MNERNELMNRNVITIVGIMAGACLVFTGSAWAQMQQRAGQPQQPETAQKRTELLEALEGMQQRATMLQQRINAIARQAEEQNPDLQKLHADLMDVYQKKLAEHGYPSEEEMQQLRDLQERLQIPGASDMEDAERQRLTQQFNAGVAKLQESQERAQSDRAVLAAQQAFEQARVIAMSEIDPEAQALEREFKAVQGKLEDLRTQLQQVLQAPRQ